MTVFSEPADSSRQPGGSLAREPGARRTLLAWLLLPLVVTDAGAHQPEGHGLDLEERIRLRRELRQAYRDRMREASTSSHAAEDAAPPANLEEPASGPATEQATRPPEPGAPSPARHEGWSGRDMVGEHHGRMALSDEERRQLRRQLREQRALRRGASPGADEGASSSPPQP